MAAALALLSGPRGAEQDQEGLPLLVHLVKPVAQLGGVQ
jgi:hypothetical protein